MIIKNWQTYWKSHNLWPDAHVYGTCLVNHNIKKFCVLIPKNASTWLRSISKYGFIKGNYHADQLIEKGYQPLVILRDPYDRWASGITEFFTRRGLWQNWRKDFNRFVTEFIFTRIAFDEHTESQCMFLEGIDTSTCVFFKHDNDLNKNFSHYLNRQGIDNNLINLKKQYSSAGKKLEIKNHFSALVQLEPKTKLDAYYEVNFELIKTKLDAYYKVDFDLINSVQYYKQQGNT